MNQGPSVQGDDALDVGDRHRPGPSVSAAKGSPPRELPAAKTRNMMVKVQGHEPYSSPICTPIMASQTNLS